jgi:hypothetical protein
MAASGLVGEVNRPGAWGPGCRELRERRSRELVCARGGRTGSWRGYGLRHRRCSGRRRVSRDRRVLEVIAAALLGACCAGQLPDRLADNCPGGSGRILTGRTPTRSSSRPTPSPACARRASCATSEKTPKTFLSRWPKRTSSYHDRDGPAPGAHPLLDQVPRKPSGHPSRPDGCGRRPTGLSRDPGDGRGSLRAGPATYRAAMPVVLRTGQIAPANEL